jgi:hypothetical protein
MKIQHGQNKRLCNQLLEPVFSLQSALKLYKQDNFWLSEIGGYTDTQTAR